MRPNRLLGCLCSLAGLGVTLVAPPASAQAVAPVPAAAETEPVAAAGDVAIRVDPIEPAASLVIGADRRAGLDVYDLAGNRVQHLERPGRANGVDLRPGFSLGGRVVDLVATGGRGIAFFAVDPARRRLLEVGARAFPGPYSEEGICLYRSDLSERFYAFTTEPDGVVTQWELVDRAGLVDVRWVRSFDAGSAVEGCVADDELGRLYVSEKQAGIWEYGAEPEAWPALRTPVDRVGAGHLAGVGGLAIVRQPGRRGYLLASSPGDSTFAVYRRQTHAFLGRLQVVAGAEADGCSTTDGIEALAASLGPDFPFGLFICQDGSNTAPGPEGRQDFKYVRLERVLAVAA